jgi:hypothetical protein
LRDERRGETREFDFASKRRGGKRRRRTRRTKRKTATAKRKRRNRRRKDEEEDDSDDGEDFDPNAASGSDEEGMPNFAGGRSGRSRRQRQG